MQRRTLLWILAGTASGALLVWVVVLPAIGPRVDTTRANFARLKKGMTIAEVEGVLGGPPDNRTASPRPRGFKTGSWACTPGTLHEVFAEDYWLTNDGWVEVWFDRNGRAYQLEWLPPQQPSWVQRVLRAVRRALP